MTYTLHKTIGAMRRWVNHQLGLDLVRFSGQHNLRSHLSLLILDYKINLIIDVGANEGQFGEFLRELGFTGQIISFEPVEAAFNKLHSVSAGDPNWQIFNFALGAEPAEAYINVSEFTSFSSLLTPSDYALGHWKNSRVDHQQKITIRTLDQCFEEELIPASEAILLKMDTQGYDLEVFKGGRQSLSKISAILSELSLVAVYNEMPDYKKSLSTYEAAGFFVSGFYPITRNKNLSLNEVDCVFVKPESYADSL